MLAPTLGERGWNRHRLRPQVDHLVRQVEPHVLPAPDLAGDQYESRCVLREPRREFVQLAHRQSAAFARTVLDGRDLEDGAVDSLSAALGVVEHALEELELVLRRPRM